MFRAGLYARVSTNDQQTLAIQNRAMREYAARRGELITLQVREVNSGAAPREAREKVLEAAVAGRSTSCWFGVSILLKSGNCIALRPRVMNLTDIPRARAARTRRDGIVNVLALLFAVIPCVHTRKG